MDLVKAVFLQFIHDNGLVEVHKNRKPYDYFIGGHIASESKEFINDLLNEGFLKTDSDNEFSAALVVSDRGYELMRHHFLD